MEKYCKECGSLLIEESSFCPSCGAEISDDNKKLQEITTKPELNYDSSKANRNLSATKHLISGIKNIPKGIILSFQNKRYLALIIILTLLWTIPSILAILGNESQILKIISYITYSLGGISSSILGILGGITGKIFYAYFLIPIFLGNNPLRGVIKAGREISNTFNTKLVKSFSSFVFGIGAALILYNFFNFSLAIQNSMIGIIGFIFAFRTVGQDNNFWKEFVYKLSKKDKNYLVKTTLTNRLFYGLSIGFLFAIILSLIPLDNICYIVGVFLLIVSIFLKIVSKSSKQEVTV